MKIIHMIKIARYDPTLCGTLSLYEGYCQSALQITQPHIIEGGVFLAERDSIPVLCSALVRAQETARLFSPDYTSTVLLNEIPFDLRQLASEAEFVTQGSELVRQRFLEAFEQDLLLETRAALFERIEKLVDLLKKEPDNTLRCISHSFFMKILEAFMGTRGAIVREPRLLAAYLPIDHNTYEYREGFTVKL